MKRKEDRPMSKHTVFLFTEDMDKLKVLHGKIGASKIIRLLVSKHLKRVEERVMARRQ